jgi:hypothetical protein
MKIEDILNMEITPGIHQWSELFDKKGVTCGSLEITLPNGTDIRICSVVRDDGTTSCEISIHNINDTRLTIFSKVKKSIRRSMGTMWTKISGVA